MTDSREMVETLFWQECLKFSYLFTFCDFFVGQNLGNQLYSSDCLLFINYLFTLIRLFVYFESAVYLLWVSCLFTLWQNQTWCHLVVINTTEWITVGDTMIKLTLRTLRASSRSKISPETSGKKFQTLPPCVSAAMST